MNDYFSRLLFSGIPGAQALPSAAIVAIPEITSVNAPTHLSPGDVIFLEGKNGLIGSFTPLHKQQIPRRRVTIADESRFHEVEFNISTPGLEQGQFSIFLCIMPHLGLLDRIDDHKSAIMLQLSDWSTSLRHHLHAELTIGGNRVPLVLHWQTVSGAVSRLMSGVIAPLNYCRALVEPVLAHVTLDSRIRMANGDEIDLTLQPFVLRIGCDPELLRRFYRKHQIGPSARLKVFPNALPLGNFELKRWDRRLSFGHFLHQQPLRPLGVAGIGYYHSADTASKLAKEKLDAIGNRVIYEMKAQADESNAVVGSLFHQIIDPVANNNRISLLHMWMTRGEELNGQSLSYPERNNETVPNQLDIKELARLQTIVSCIGGKEFSPNLQDTSITLGLLAAQPPALITRTGIHQAIITFLAGFGCEDFQVRSIGLEARVFDGKRRVVTAIKIGRNEFGAQLGQDTISCLQTWLNDSMPIGTAVVVEAE